MKKNTCHILLMLSFAFNIAFIGMLGFRLIRGTQQPSEPPGSGWWQSSDLYEALSEEKKAELDSLRWNFRSEIWPINKNMAEIRFSIFEEIEKQNPDSTIIEERVRQLTQLHTMFEMKASYQLLKEKEVFPDSLQQRYMDYFSRRMNRRPRSTRRSSE